MRAGGSGYRDFNWHMLLGLSSMLDSGYSPLVFWMISSATARGTSE